MRVNPFFVFICLLIAAVMFFPATTRAELNAYMKITGSVQGEILSGDSTRGDSEGWIIIASFGHNLYIPRDPGTGQVSGRRVHTPLKILKKISKASPTLYSS